MDHPPPSTCQENIRQPCHPNASWACCRLSSSSAWAVLMLASWQWKKMMRAKIRSPLTHHDRRYLWFSWNCCSLNNSKVIQHETFMRRPWRPKPRPLLVELLKHALCTQPAVPTEANENWRDNWSAFLEIEVSERLTGATVVGINGGSKRCHSQCLQMFRFHLWPCWCCRKFHLMSSSCGEGLRIGFSNALQADGVLGHLESGLNHTSSKPQQERIWTKSRESTCLLSKQT